MSSFMTRVEPTPIAPLDPKKHVKYTLGMVLGVDDFTQEFAYLSGHDQWLARDLLGYGTAWGLRVHVETGDRGPEVVVEEGVAISPRGQLIHVAPAQCAKLNDWISIEENRAEMLRRAGSPPVDALKLYVVLCYRDCATDNGPIPGEPCRSEADSMAPSRLADDFKLELRFDPPNQCEEDALRDFVRWLRQIEVSDDPGGFTSLDDFISAIRNSAHALTSPPCSASDFMFDSPPVSIRVHPNDLCEYLRTAFRIWVTELRPRWRPAWLGKDRTCTGHVAGEDRPGEEDCLLLAELAVPVLATLTGGLVVGARENIEINEDRRPYLIHLRMLQEWLLCGKAFGIIESFESPPAGQAHVHSLDDLSDVNVSGAPDGRVLIKQGGQWVPGSASGGAVTDHGVLTNLGLDHHKQYLLVNPSTRALIANLNGGNQRITDLAQGINPNDAVTVQQAIKRGDRAGQDLRGTYADPFVAGLQGRPVANAAPNLRDVLTWTGGQWEPTPIRVLPFANIVRVDVRLYEIWFNIDAPGNAEEIEKLVEDQFDVSRETDTPTAFLTKINLAQPQRGQPPAIQRTRRNVFQVALAAESELLRFVFKAGSIKLASGPVVTEYAHKAGIQFIGSGEKDTITVFVRGSKG